MFYYDVLMEVIMKIFLIITRLDILIKGHSPIITTSDNPSCRLGARRLLVLRLIPPGTHFLLGERGNFENLLV